MPFRGGYRVCFFYCENDRILIPNSFVVTSRFTCYFSGKVLKWVHHCKRFTVTVAGSPLFSFHVLRGRGSRSSSSWSQKMLRRRWTSWTGMLSTGGYCTSSPLGGSLVHREQKPSAAQGA